MSHHNSHSALIDYIDGFQFIERILMNLILIYEFVKLKIEQIVKFI